MDLPGPHAAINSTTSSMRIGVPRRAAAHVWRWSWGASVVGVGLCEYSNVL